MKAQSPYPAQLKIFLESGIKTFSTLIEAAPMLTDLGISVEEDEPERLQRMRTKGIWAKVTGRREKMRQLHITEEDLRALME